MKCHLPFYDLLHHEIKACTDHLLETCLAPHFSFERDSIHILGRLTELHQFSKKILNEEHYHPLASFRHYLENTMLSYQDAENHHHSIRLSEAIEILALPHFQEMCNTQFPETGTLMCKSLHKHCIEHCLEEIKPGKDLFKTLLAIKSVLSKISKS